MVPTPAPHGALESTSLDLLQASLSADKHVARSKLSEETESLNRLGAWYITHRDQAWPGGIPDRTVLRVIGQLPQRGVAIVGARNADAYGLELTHRIAKTAVDRGFAVVSGGAMGIDGAAHKASLMHGGHTIVVLGSGLSHPAPRQHIHLFRAAVESGALVSPFPCSQRPSAWTYPKRNPVISALAEAVIVVQAAEHSGSLQTARAALKQGKSVWVVPGNMDNPLHVGCHRLLHEGARVLTRPDEWFADSSTLGNQFNDSPSKPGASNSSSKLWSAATGEPEPIEALANRARMGISDALSDATILQLSGWLRAHEGGRFSRSEPRSD